MADKEMNDCLESFASDCVSLNENRVERIHKGIEVVTSLLKNNDPYKDIFIDLIPQGSFRNGTAIRPVSEDDDFDLDLLFLQQQVPGWEAKDYLNHLHNFFYGFERYRDIVDRRGKTRCVTLDYESDFHIDIVPCVQLGSQKFIFNKNANQPEPTDGDGYAEWFAAQNAITNGNLAKVVQLIKYLRDYKGTFKVKSIVLTTLLGLQVNHSDDPGLYTDLTTTCETVLSRLNAYLQANPVMPDVCNPALISEKFTSRHWTQEEYENFREKFDGYSSRILAALASTSEDFEAEMIDIFGDECTLEKAASSVLSISPHTVAIRFPSAQEDFIENYIREASPVLLELEVDADIKRMKFLAKRLSMVRSALPKNASLQFFVKPPRNIDGSRHTLYWKVRNTGEEARAKGQLRGEITRDEGSYRKKETASYSGTHYVEAYLIDTTNGILVGKGSINVPIC